MQNAINSSQNSSISSVDLAQYIQTLTNTTLSNVPSHCQNVKKLDNVEKILVDLCVNKSKFDQPTLTKAISTFYDNFGKQILLGNLAYKVLLSSKIYFSKFDKIKNIIKLDEDTDILNL